MKSLLKRVIKNSERIDITTHLSLPSDISLSGLHDNLLVGYLARAIALKSHISKEQAELLFFNQFINTDTNKMEKHVIMAKQIVEWMKDDEVLEVKINTLGLNSQDKNNILFIVDVFKKETLSYFPNTPERDRVGEPEEKIERYEKWKVYRDVIYACTDKKFLLISKAEEEKLKIGEVLCKGEIVNATDIPLCRNLAKETLEKESVPPKNMMSWLLVISEAITNTIKHAEKGKMRIIKNGTRISVVVEDTGRGFDLDNLPNAVLMAGYSTKRSLGQGFNLMMRMTKQLCLYTSSKGTTIVLIFENEGEDNERDAK